MGTIPKLHQSPSSNGMRSHTATSMIPPGSLAKPSPCIPGTNPLASHEITRLCFVGRPTWLCEYNGLHRHWQATLIPPWTNPREIEWSPLPTLHGVSGGNYEVAPLIAPQTVTPCSQTLLHCGKRFKIVECWWLANVYMCCFYVGF